MIIYGSRMYFKKNVVKSYGECEYCGVYGKQISYKARKFGHIYFIPLIPMGAFSQVLRECKNCSMGAHINNDQLEPIVDGLADNLKSWVDALTQGHREMPPAPGEEPLNIGAMIAGSLSDFYCLKEIENIETLTQLLDANNLHMEKELVMGRWHELQGNLTEARMSYDASHRIEPQSVYPLYHLARTHLKLGEIEAAEEVFQRYLQLEPDDISVYVELAQAYEGSKNYPKIVETYDKIYELNPSVVSDKGMKKVYKKACKKSGVQGKFLGQM